MKIRIILLIVLWMVGAVSYAAVSGSTDDPSVIGGGARPLGMGKAFAAIADDADAPFINPAGIAGIKAPQIMTMYTNLMGEVYYAEYSGAVPTQNGTFGMGYITTGVNGIQTIVHSQEVLTDYYDSLLVFTYSSPLSRFFGYGRNLFVGGNFKIFNRGFSGGVNQSATGYSADVGLKFVFSPYLSFGVNRQNVLPVSMGGVIHFGGGTDEAIAGITKIGLAIKPVYLYDKLIIDIDADLPAQSTRPITAHLGCEYKINKFATVRGGFDQSIDPGTASRTNWSPTLGFSIGDLGLRLDYAYHPYYNDPSLASSFISLSYQGPPTYALHGEAQ
jgi:hypothetical protein